MKVLVYYDPKNDELLLRQEEGFTCYGALVTNNAMYEWKAIWDLDCEKNFILIGEL